VSKIKIAIITGSTRPGRVNPAVADWVLRQAKGRTDADYELVDIAAYDLSRLDEPERAFTNNYSHEHTKAWSAKIAGFDGFIFVTPEYNHSIPGALKNAIDFLYNEWKNKAAGFVSYGGGSCGARAVEHLRLVLAELSVATVRGHVLLSLFTDFEDLKIFKPMAIRETDLIATFNQVESWAKAMQTVRFVSKSQ
jgi:NAD(P)H-dependent FMN reductase